MKDLIKITPFIIGVLGMSAFADSSFQTKIGVDSFYFTEEADIASQNDSSVSYAIEPSYVYSKDFGKKVFNSKLFYRGDANDEARSHFDIRELSWAEQIGSFEYKIGISKEFWGVVESYRLVDIINQVDFAEDIFFKERLGQPMVKFSYLSDYGALSFWVLPYFRERTYASNKSRVFSGNTTVDVDEVHYESSEDQAHIEYAFRYAKTFGDFDIGLSYFQGTNREPSLNYNSTTDKLEPFYDQTKVLSTDIQWTGESLLLKLEAVNRSPENFSASSAAVYGLEYTLYGIYKGHDLGILVEHLYDDRGADYTSFENDVFLGFRYVLNDLDASQYILGVISDSQTGGKAFRFEGSTRISSKYTIGIESQVFENIADDDLFFADIQNDDYAKLRLEYYF